MEAIKAEQFWLGFVFCTVFWVLVWLSVGRIMGHEQPEPAQSREIIAAYQQGRSDALKTNPFNYDLEQTCVAMWANSKK